MAVPNSSPRASAMVSVRTPQMLMLADGTFFPPGCCAIPWGRASGPTSLVPEALEECVHSFKVFPQRHLCAKCLFQPASTVPYACVDIRVRLVHI
jgi:hypothetical protein